MEEKEKGRAGEGEEDEKPEKEGREEGLMRKGRGTEMIKDVIK